jgi:hypothetical protein
MSPIDLLWLFIIVMSLQPRRMIGAGRLVRREPNRGVADSGGDAAYTMAADSPPGWWVRHASPPADLVSQGSWPMRTQG